MKLPNASLTLEQQLEEFDNWITPSIQEIQDTDKYQDELKKVNLLIKSLGEATNNFSDIDHCNPVRIASTCVDLIERAIAINGYGIEEGVLFSVDLIESLASLLFMVTGKSDNNLKCQFPVCLLQNFGAYDFPHRSSSKGVPKFSPKSLGRVIKSDKLAKVVSEALVYANSYEELRYLEGEAKWLLGQYVASILKDEQSVKQFWALGLSYFNLKQLEQDFEQSLLAPIVIFKVRGSVSASGGHIPERKLRDMMECWGLERGVDFNLDDVILGDADKTELSKTRAYDFVLPYRTVGWEPKIFMQCQFYAGDSGSVSHKVVDQTSASRSLTANKYPDAKFIEYLDGAGYFSSLNTDLQHMLGMNTTKDFVQIRTAHLKLRRELQSIGFLTPLEVEHSFFRAPDSNFASVKKILIEDGYSSDEIDRVIHVCERRGLINIEDGDIISINPDRILFARRIMLIDIVALIGEHATMRDAGRILIPGYGRLYGAALVRLSEKIDEVAPNLELSRNDFSGDIDWLISEKLIVIR